jgi:glycosyltransferase involved in cell wall biosynthesis
MEKLTVVILTYNLEEYIEQAVQSVLMQKVDFEYKIRISDDCSTDRTIEVIQKLRDAHPDKIELLLSKKNGGCLKNSNRAFSGITSEYISLLDGDDYWIGEDSLQKKIDFLDAHPEYTMCGAGTTMQYSDGSTKNTLNLKEDKEYNFEEYLKGHVPYVHPSALVLRNCIYKNGIPQIYYDVEDTFENCAVRGDEFRFMTHFEKGKLKVFSEVQSCYRIHERGIWQGASDLKRTLETAISKNFFDKYYVDLDTEIFHKMCIASYHHLCNELMNKGISDKYILSEEETYLLTEYFRDICKRDIRWTNNKIRYVPQKEKVCIVKRIWRTVRKIWV